MTDLQAKLRPSQLIYQRLHQVLTDNGVGLFLEDPPYDVTGTHETYVVVRDAPDGWQNVQRPSSARHPIVATVIYSGDTYLEAESATLHDAHGKCLAVFDIINRLLDYAPSDPNLIACRLEQEPSVHPVNEDDTETNTAVFLAARYELTV